jgi:signal peptidase I
MSETTTMQESAAQEPAAPQGHHGEDTTLSEYLESLLVTVLLALFATTFVLQAFKIPSPSMESTLLVGDHLLVNKFIFGGHGAWYEKILPYRPLERGDIIVFKYPYQDHTHYVKRVIGLPGDHLKLVDQRVFVNGRLLTEPYVVHDPAARYCIRPKSSRNGPARLRSTSRATRLSFLRGNTLPWVTTATRVPIAGTGDSSIVTPSWVGRS